MTLNRYLLSSTAIVRRSMRFAFAGLVVRQAEARFERAWRDAASRVWSDENLWRPA